MKTTKKKLKQNNHIVKFRKKALLGIIDILILHWIKKQPLCGQDIMNKLQNEFSVKIGPGTMYPILFQLRDDDFVEIKQYHKKKMYFVTNKGKAIAREGQKEYATIQEILTF